MRIESHNAVAYALILSTILLCGCATEDAVPSDVSQSVKEVCSVQAQFICDETCMDGFGEECYFDSGEHGNLSSGMHSLPEETKAACFALHSYAHCVSCHNSFELRKNDALEKVSCEEFFQAIEDKNRECGGCLEVVASGCC